MPLQGNLEDMNLANLVQIMCQEMRSARIAVTNSHRSGEIYLSDGQIVHASVGTLSGREALYELLSWDHGTFVFDGDVHAHEKTISAGWNELILGAMMQAAERAAEPVIPKPEQPRREPNPVYRELEEETWRLMRLAQSNQVRFVAMDPVAFWTNCDETRGLLTPWHQRQIDLAAPAAQSTWIVPMLQRIGYEGDYAFNLTRAKERLNFHDPAREIDVNVFLDAFQMYHRLDLRAVLSGGDAILPVTQVVLARLQIVEISNSDLAELCALFIDHDLGTGHERVEIDATQIAQLCAEDWGWYKTATLNLDRLGAYAEKHLEPANQEKILRRIYNLRNNIEVRPKSLRWLTRAGLGESVRWYEIPERPSRDCDLGRES